MPPTVSPGPPPAREAPNARTRVPSRPSAPRPASDEDAQVSDRTCSQYRAGRRSPERQAGERRTEGGQGSGEEARSAGRPRPGLRIPGAPAEETTGSSAARNSSAAQGSGSRARGDAPTSGAIGSPGCAAGWAGRLPGGRWAGAWERRGAAVGSPPSVCVGALCAAPVRPGPAPLAPCPRRGRRAPH